MALENKTVVLTIKGTTEGIDQAKASLQSLGVAYEQSNRAIDQRVPALEKLAQKYNDTLRIETQYVANQAKLKAAAEAYTQKTGDSAKAQELLSLGLAGLSKKHEDAMKAANGSASAHAGMNMRFQEGMHSARGFTEMVMAGQNPIRAFTMEASRAGSVLLQVDQGFRSALMGALPWVAGLAVVGTAIAVVTARMMALNAETKTFTATSQAFNNKNFSSGELSSMAHGMASSGSFSRSDTDAALVELTKTRTLSRRTAQEIADASVSFATATGGKLTDATKFLADAAGKGYEGIKSLQDAYGMLSPAQMEHIRQLTEAGRQTDAFAIAMGALKTQMGASKETMEGNKDGFRDMVNAWNDRLDWFVQTDSFKVASSFLDKWAKRMEAGATTILAPSSKLDDARTNAFNAMNDYQGAVSNRIPGNASDDVRIEQAAGRLAEAQAKVRALEQEVAEKGKAASDAQAKLAADQARNISQTNVNHVRAAYAPKIAAAGLTGYDQERALAPSQINEEYKDKDSATKAEALRLRLVEIDTREAAAAAEAAKSTNMQAEAQDRLTLSAGKSWDVRRQALIDNAKAANDHKYGVGKLSDENTKADTNKIDADQFKTQQEYLRSLDKQVADAKSKATTKSFGDIEADSWAQAKVAADQYGLSVDQIQPKLLAVAQAQQKAQLQSVADSVSPDAAYSDRIAKLRELQKRQDEFKVSNEDITRAIQAEDLKRLQSSRDWEAGVAAGFMKYADDASNAGAAAQQGVAKGMSAMEDFFVNIGTGSKSGAQSFKAFADSIIADIERMMVKMSITGPMSQAISGWMGMGSQTGQGGGYSSSSSALGAGGMISLGGSWLGRQLGMSSASSDIPSGGLMASDAAQGISDSAASSGGFWDSIAGLFADGGKITGKGGPRDDSILAAVSNGEYVINAKDTARTLPLLEHINNGGKLPKFADGGMVGGKAPANSNSPMSMPMPSRGVSSAGGSAVQFHPGAVVVNAPGATAEDAHAIATEVANRIVAQAAPAIARAGAMQGAMMVPGLVRQGGDYMAAVRGTK